MDFSMSAVRKNIAGVSFFFKLCCTPIFLIHILISSMNIYIYTRPVKIHCHYIIMVRLNSHAEF